MYKIPVKKRMVYSNAYAVRQQCLKYNDMFVRLDASVADLSKLPIISIEEGGDGIYTFLFDEMGTLRTGKVQNMFELETKHLVLTFKYRPNEVIAAGELKKSGNTIVFNLLSGTYMKELFYTISNAEVSNYINEVTALFNKVGYNDVSYTQQVLLSNEAAPLTKEQLDEYANIGVIIKLYKSKIACMQEPKILLAEMRLYKERGMNDLVDKTLSRLESSQNYMLYGGSLLTLGGSLPTLGGSLPTLGGSLPTLGGSLPTLGGSLPTLGGSLPTLGGSLPTLGGSKKRKTTRRRKTRKVQKQKGTRGRTQSTF